jgi:N4-gp56 family major capsid protein
VADQSTSTAVNNNMLPVYFTRRLMKVLDEQVWLYQLAEKYPLPEGNGTQMTFNGWRRIAAPSSTLAELTGNAATVLSSRKINVTIQSFGRAVKISDLFEKTGIAPAAQGAIERLMQSAALAKDNVVQLAIFQNDLTRVGKDNGVSKSSFGANTKILSAWLGSAISAFCANTGTTSNTLQFGLPVVFPTSAAQRLVSATKWSISSGFGPIALRKATDRLRRFDAPTWGDGSYVAVVNPKAMTSLLANPDAKQWYVNYQGGPEAMFKGEVRSPVHGVRIIMSTNIPRYATSAISASLTPVLGMECVAVTELGGLEMIVKRPGEQSTNDAFNLFSVVSYKFRAVGAVTNPSAGCLLITNERV